MRRTNLVVPAHLVASLRMPPLAVTTGGADVEWVEVPTTIWRFRRRPAQRLPLDPRSARLARRYIRFAPWSPVASLLAFLPWAAGFDDEIPRLGRLLLLVTTAVVFLGLSQQAVAGALPRQKPSRTGRGDLRIPRVPVEVAEQWVQWNPGVVATDEPAPRPHSRRWYATWSTSLVLASIVLFAVLANDGREDFLALWAAAPALFLTGVVAALKTLPPGYIRLEHDDS